MANSIWVLLTRITTFGNYAISIRRDSIEAYWAYREGSYLFLKGREESILVEESVHYLDEEIGD